MNVEVATFVNLYPVNILISVVKCYFSAPVRKHDGFFFIFLDLRTSAVLKQQSSAFYPIGRIEVITFQM